MALLSVWFSSFEQDREDENEFLKSCCSFQIRYQTSTIDSTTFTYAQFGHPAKLIPPVEPR